MAALDPLWEPVRIGAVTAPNRVFLSAHNLAHTPEQMAAYLATRARGGAGLIVMGGVPVHPSSMSNPRLIRAWERESVAELARVAQTVLAGALEAPTVQQLGGRAAVFGQIFHGGPNDPGNSVFDHHHAAIAPSAVAQPPAGRIPKVAEQADIDEIVDGFAATAHHLQLAGFDGIEISASHGYLAHAFMSPTMNRRTDAYGGSAANRARFALEVGAAIRERCGADFPVILRLTIDERLGERGMTPDTSRDLLEALFSSGHFDACSISGGVYATLDETVAPSSAERDTVFADSARVAGEVLDGLGLRARIPVMLTGSVMELERAAEVVETGLADLVGMTRSQIADPELVAKAASGRSEEIRHCVRSNQGCWRGIKTRNGVTCTVNPSAGRELQWGAPVATERPRHVLVVGGGPAGLTVADVAATRGHRVTLLERSDLLGGQLRLAAEVPHRSSWRQATTDMEAAVRRAGVDVRTGCEATAQRVLAEDPDAIVIATGSSWSTDGWSYALAQEEAPRIAPDALVCGPVEALMRREELSAAGGRVLVVDDTGSYVPIGVAEALAECGADVELISPRAAIGDGLALTGEATFAVPRLLAAGIAITTRTAVMTIDRDHVDVRSLVTGAERVVAANAVITCQHRDPHTEVYDALAATLTSTAGPELYRIGDALAPREADDAIYEATKLGRSL